MSTPTGPTAYPSNWRPQGAPPPDSAAPPNIEALQICIDSYVASLSPAEFDALVQRTRGGM